MGMADAIVMRFGKKPGAKPPADADAAGDDAAPGDDSMKEDAPAPKPGAQGKILMKAISKGDAEAVEEAIRAICNY